MKNANKIIVIVVLCLVVLFGIGQFFSFSTSTSITPSGSSSSSAGTSTNQSGATAQAPATQVVQYVPSALASSTPVKSGSCWTNSIAAPFRPDAWRCTAGNNVSDPCFQIPGNADVLCNVNPTKSKDTSTFALALTQTLPTPQPVQGVEPSGMGWLIELQDGTLCTPFTGTLPFTADGQTATYGCAPGSLGNDIVIFDINSSSSVWMAHVGTLIQAPKNSTSGLPVVASSSTIPVAEVWQ